jgi:hypothetical protein
LCARRGKMSKRRRRRRRTRKQCASAHTLPTTPTRRSQHQEASTKSKLTVSSLLLAPHNGLKGDATTARCAREFAALCARRRSCHRDSMLVAAVYRVLRQRVKHQWPAMRLCVSSPKSFLFAALVDDCPLSAPDPAANAALEACKI